MRYGEAFLKTNAAVRVVLLPLCIAALVPLGCHSPYINATVENHTGGPISPVEVDYPSASFGIPSMEAGAAYKYRFKVLGSGSTKVLWTDAQEHEHSYPGPSLHEGQEGSLRVVLNAASVTWTPSLQP